MMADGASHPFMIENCIVNDGKWRIHECTLDVSFMPLMKLLLASKTENLLGFAFC